jgi:hypothetical protein
MRGGGQTDLLLLVTLLLISLFVAIRGSTSVGVGPLLFLLFLGLAAEKWNRKGESKRGRRYQPHDGQLQSQTRR